ncbi:MAG: hypothetical protein QXP77_01220 [Candidatus Aenigmatarchaeota archaeon]
MFPVKNFQDQLYQKIEVYKDPLIIGKVKESMNNVKNRIWPVLQKIKGYGKFKEPDDIYVTDDLPKDKPAATLFAKDWLGRVKKYLIVSKDVIHYPKKLLEYIIGHESTHASENVSGDLVSEASIDKNLKDAYERIGDREGSKVVERFSGYLNKFYWKFAFKMLPLYSEE